MMEVICWQPSWQPIRTGYYIPNYQLIGTQYYVNYVWYDYDVVIQLGY